MRLSIRNVLAVVVGGLLVAAQLALISYGSSSTYKALVDVQVEHLRATTDTVNKAFSDLVENNVTVASVYSSIQALKDLLTQGGNEETLAQAADRLTQFVNTEEDFESATVFDTKGQVLVSVGRNGKRLGTPNLADRDFVQAALAGQAGSSGTPIISRTTGKIVMMFSTPLHDAAGKVIGGFCFSHNYERILKDYIDDVKIGESGYPFVLSDKGVILAHPKRELLFKDMSGEAFTKRILSEPKGVMTYTFEGKSKVLTWQHDPQRKWTFVSTALEDDLTAVAVEQRTKMLIAGALITILGLAVVIAALNKLVVKPVRAFEGFASKVAAGDMSAALSEYKTAELQSLADNLKVMLAQLKERLGFAQGVVDGLSTPFYITDAEGRITHVSTELLTLAQVGRDRALGQTPDRLLGQPADAQLSYSEALRTKKPVHDRMVTLNAAGEEARFLREDASPISDLDGQLIGSICLYTDLTEIKMREEQLATAQQVQLEQAAKAEVVASQVSSLTQELAAQVEQVRVLATCQGDRVAESRTAMGQMSVSIIDVAKNASDTARISRDAKHKAEAGAESVRFVMEAVEQVKQRAEGLRHDMQGLGESAANIDNIMTVISDIADQTNLLALNAAIEAARAGDAGRGFAVVADEVRKLAEKTMSATKEVGSVVSGIQRGAAKGISGVDEAAKGVQQAAGLAETAGAALREIVSLVSESATQVEAIAAATEEQSAATEQISSGVDEMGRTGQETVNATNESVEALHGLAEQTMLLERLTGEMRQGEPDQGAFRRQPSRRMLH